MSNINLNKVEDSLKKSGFILEHQVTEKLRNDTWTVINNRYYLDDVQEIAREIDLVAYKTHSIKLDYPKPIENLHIYTTLIVSCKKNEEKLWALLFRECDKTNPNMDWFPIKNWTNNKIFKYLLSKKDWRTSYLEKSKDFGIHDEIFEPTGHLFAYQEIDKNKYTLQNQNNIFGAVSSLMKAESYELSSLERRKNDFAIYNFNLISIVDTELINILYKGKSIHSSEVNEAKAVFNYIVNKQETSSRIHFCTFDGFEDCLKSYKNLHKFHKDFFSSFYEEFYENIFNTPEKINLIKQNSLDYLLWEINYYYKKEFGFDHKIKDFEFELNKKNKLNIYVKAIDQEIEFLNNNNSVKKVVQRFLKDTYKFTSTFVFDDIENNIPF